MLSFPSGSLGGKVISGAAAALAFLTPFVFAFSWPKARADGTPAAAAEAARISRALRRETRCITDSPRWDQNRWESHLRRSVSGRQTATRAEVAAAAGGWG